MTYEGIADAIAEIASSIGCKSAYRQWPKDSAPPPPYVLFYFAGSDNVYADDCELIKIANLNIELYTDNKEPALEDSLERKMKELELNCQKSETYIQSEEMYEVLYETEVIIDG